ncbi:MAG: NCS2 family permease [Candidatus Thermoplasmatota archaeon]|nr:NCS2 family permease [Candidatus Thermoplasmatota archaeon]
MEVQAADDYFGYTEKGSSFDGEVRAGITTFLTMAYILLVNPAMLTLAIGDGTDAGNAQAFADILFATAIAAIVGCGGMGLWANLPFALAPGMGLNAYFTFTVVNFGMGIAWELALFAVFVEGLLFLVMSLPQIPVVGTWRSEMINSIPTDLKVATGAGIGMFLAIIGLREMGWIRDDGAVLVNLADTEAWGGTIGEVGVSTAASSGEFAIYAHGAIISMIALIAIAIMMARGIKGAMIYGIMGAAVWGWLVGAYDPYNDYLAGGAGWGAIEATAPAIGDIVSMPSLPEETLMAAFGPEGMGAAGDHMGDFLLVMIAFLFVDVFDTSGTLYSVGRQAGYVDESDELHNSDEAFASDAVATIVGAVCGTSTTTTYIESAAGVEDGGKTGLVAVTVGVLMLSGLFFTDLFASIPQFAMASALVIIGAMMMRQAADIDWSDGEVALPAFLTMVLMPFTYSIADGIAWGIISYVAIKLGMGKMDELNPVMYTLFVLMLMFYIGPGDTSTFGFLFGDL